MCHMSHRLVLPRSSPLSLILLLRARIYYLNFVLDDGTQLVSRKCLKSMRIWGALMDSDSWLQRLNLFCSNPSPTYLQLYCQWMQIFSITYTSITQVIMWIIGAFYGNYYNLVLQGCTKRKQYLFDEHRFGVSLSKNSTISTASEGKYK